MFHCQGRINKNCAQAQHSVGLGRKFAASTEVRNYQSLVAEAYEALDIEMMLPHGPLRFEAMKKANIMRLAAERLSKPRLKKRDCGDAKWACHVKQLENAVEA
jgi:hypothetical protein